MNDQDMMRQILALRQRVDYLSTLETLKMPVWDDLRVELTVRGSGAKVPTYANFIGGLYAYEFDNAILASEKEVDFKMQMPHGWRIGSAVHLHVHWIAKTTGSAGQKVRWGLEYTVCSINTVAAAPGAFIYATDPESPPSSTPTANTHYLTEWASIDMTGKTMSCFILGRMFRNSSDAADTYTDSAYVLGVDAHYQIDSIGSTQELVK